MRLLLALLGAAFPAQAAELTPVQMKLIGLLTYIQVSRDHCGYLVDIELLRAAAAKEGVTFTTPAQTKVRDEGFATAEQAFRPRTREIVECGYAIERFGPNGSEIPGLIERRPPSSD